MKEIEKGVFRLIEILSGGFFPLFLLDDLAAVVGSAGRADMMGLFGTMALGAKVHCRRLPGIVAQSVTGTRLAFLSFW